MLSLWRYHVRYHIRYRTRYRFLDIAYDIVYDIVLQISYTISRTISHTISHLTDIAYDIAYDIASYRYRIRYRTRYRIIRISHAISTKISITIVLISNVYLDQVAAAERKLKHKLYPVNAMLEIKHCDVVQSAPKEELHQMLVGVCGEHVIPATRDLLCNQGDIVQTGSCSEPNQGRCSI